MNIWHTYVTGKKADCVVHFLSLLAVWWPAHIVHETTTFLLATLPNIHRFLKLGLTK